MRVLLLGTRLVLACFAIGAAATYVGLQIHKHANIVDIEVLPATDARAGAEPTPVSPRDLPSDGVREHIDFYPQGGPGCTSKIDRNSAPSLAFGIWAEIGSRFDVCLDDFDPYEPITIRLDGRGSHLVDKVTGSLWSWNPPPDILPRRYRIRATQGRRKATANVRLVTSREAFVRVRAIGEMPAAAYEIIVGGGPHARRVPVHVYRAVEPTTPRFDYLSTIMVQTNRFGNGSVVVRETGGSTHTCYVVEPGFTGHSQVENQFCFAWPDE